MKHTLLTVRNAFLMQVYYLYYQISNFCIF